MPLDQKIFKAYDIRGVYPRELDEKAARTIGRAIVSHLRPVNVAIARDARLGSESLSRALIKGILEQGANVSDIGLVSTDVLYFAVGHYGYDAGVMVTASHNPKEFNGFKICREKAIPLSSDTGLCEIRRICLEEDYQDPIEKGERVEKNVLPDYLTKIFSFIETPKMKPLTVVVDAGNGMGGKIFAEIAKRLPIKLIPLYFEPDGSFPNHAPSPIEPQNIMELQKNVVDYKADLGMAFDGDADRVFFVDEKGNAVPSSGISALLCEAILKKHPKSKILYNTPMSKAVPETIEANGGSAIRTVTGHAFIKAKMREENAVFGCEHSGHYYYKDNFFADSGMITALLAMEAVSLQNRPLSECLKKFGKYFDSGEKNFHVNDKEKVLAMLRERFSGGKEDNVDGMTIDFGSWWFNARPSNTEPFLRLNVEAESKSLLDEKLAELASAIANGKA
ncbi:MAG: phosphomannomutase/phosphoglucomutase [Candidatus Diapherotrites archaeon]|nr:phosphomannomutase/phosphoglucomutase [Candidatus Diapherotrites archaeon]